MNAEILAVGTELLMGQIANTNAQYISKRLPDVGIGVYYHSVVGDNPVRLRDVLALALMRSDIIIMTGGLGPTQDDLTKETVAELMGRKLVLDQESLEKIQDFFTKYNRPMAKSNEKQAYLPEGSKVIRNSNGTAPGCIIEADNKVVIMLPGPPSEMKPMFEETVIPYFKEMLPYKLVSKYLRIFGIGESSMEEKIIDLIENQTNPTIAPYAKEGEVTLRNTVYSTEDEPLEMVAAKLLMDKNRTIAISESCTGGIVSGKLTGIPGISKVFSRGIVTYSNEAKIENLNVKKSTLKQYGAVSMETAVEMANGVRIVSNTDIGFSITGIAGPDGGTDEKPVGLVFIALSTKEGVECRKLQLWGSRERIRNVTALHVFDMIRLHLEKEK